MTDLDKLAKQFLSKDFSDDVKDAEGIAISDDDRDIEALVSILETARAAGRIEGLKEAAGIASKGWWPAASDIRARIQELEG